MTIVSVYKFKNVEAADQALEALWRRLCGGFERSAGAEKFQKKSTCMVC